MSDTSARLASQRASFATTRWSMVVQAAGASSPESREALAALCQVYWYPLYAYVRRRGHQPAESQDLVQAFFTELLAKNRLRLADQQRGRFRSFLLASLKNFLAHQWRAGRAAKRGGALQHLSIDYRDAENRYAHEPSHEATPERIFERRWALTLLENAVCHLRDDYAKRGKLPVFEQLKDYLGGSDDAAPYKEIGERLGMSEGAVKVAVHRLRQRCRELLRQEIAATVVNPEEVDDELRSFVTALET